MFHPRLLAERLIGKEAEEARACTIPLELAGNSLHSSFLLLSVLPSVFPATTDTLSPESVTLLGIS